jgi:hypothetical protein
MHANVVSVNVDDAIDPERRGLREGVIPRARQLPGLVVGYWLEPVNGNGLSITVFESPVTVRWRPKTRYR